MLNITTHANFSGYVNITELWTKPQHSIILDDAAIALVSAISADGFEPDECADVLRQVVAEWRDYVADNFDGDLTSYWQVDTDADTDNLIGDLTGFSDDDNVYLYLGV